MVTAAASATILTALRRHRLLHEIAEMQEDPYPNVQLHVHEEGFMKACLILSPPQIDPFTSSSSSTSIILAKPHLSPYGATSLIPMSIAVIFAHRYSTLLRVGR
jgi:hypothetical protein